MIILAIKLISKFTLKIFKLAGIYIHVPFCKQACYYCDFHFSTNKSLISEYLSCLQTEITLQSGYLGDGIINTIYLGGGTPSLLQCTELEKILDSVFKSHNVIRNPEITIEANPDDLTKTKLNDLLNVGFNRLSIGIQSFNDTTLQFLHRAHNSKGAIKAFSDARDTGFKNINIDLIFAVKPGSFEDFKKDIIHAISLHPEHISAYNLTVETRTVFGNWHKKGKINETGEEESALQYETLINQLEHAGYEHYEISNFSLPGKESKHNLNYWSGKPYLGVGPGAHSYNLQSRQFNIRNNANYIRSLQKNEIPSESIELSQEDIMNEYILTNLRTKWGIDLLQFEKQFSIRLENLKKGKIDLYRKNGFISEDQSVICLTNKGKLLADNVAMGLFID